jgi:hypothetical protein
VSYHYGFSGDIGAGPYERRLELGPDVDQEVSGGGSALEGALQNASGLAKYSIAIGDNETYAPLPESTEASDLALQAANQTRSAVRLSGAWSVKAASGAAARLRLDGIWVFGETVVLAGDYEE